MKTNAIIRNLQKKVNFAGGEMRRSLFQRWIVEILMVCAGLLFAGTLGFGTDNPQELVAAAHALLAAATARDTASVAKLLDPDFTWTTANGAWFTRSQAAHFPTPILAGEAANEAPKTHLYGQVGTVELTRGRVYVLQVWIKRPAGWRALIYHEVQTQPAPLAAGKEATAGTECVNPCKQVPFQPKNAAEREVIESYQAVERAVTAHDALSWGTHIADEFFAVTSNSDKPLDKATRMAGLANQKQGGIAPFPLLSARTFVFGDTVIMTSKQQPVNGPPLRVTRVWIRRNGRWVESISYQTTVTGS